jgi:sterol desaturase/sphingolipid hydroxylase (fatty acid hydroxylase superfamily)
MGVFERVISLLTSDFSIYSYLFINMNYSIGEFAQKQSDYTVLEWVLVFLCVDFGYYWFHRFGHE